MEHIYILRVHCDGDPDENEILCAYRTAESAWKAAKEAVREYAAEADYPSDEIEELDNGYVIARNTADYHFYLIDKVLLGD
jgi:hypothetical protein